MNTNIQHHACVVQKSGHYLRRGNTTQGEYNQNGILPKTITHN